MSIRKMTRKNLGGAAQQATVATTPATPQLRPTDPVRKANSAANSSHGRRRSSPDPLATLLATAGVGEITVNIPATASLAEVESFMSLAINGWKTFSLAAERMKPVIGRHLLHVKQHKLWKDDAGTYKHFTDYLKTRVAAPAPTGLGIGRSNAWDALAIAEGYPTLSLKDYARYGAGRLKIAVDHGVTEATAGFREVLEASLATTVDAFKKLAGEVIAKGGVASGTATADATPASSAAALIAITIRADASLRDRWQAALASSGLSAAELLLASLDAREAITAMAARVTAGTTASHATSPPASHTAPTTATHTPNSHAA